MGLKNLFTGGSKAEQSDCCSVEIVPAGEDDAQQSTDAETPQQASESCCQDAKPKG